jgi:hypothetical protein
VVRCLEADKGGGEEILFSEEVTSGEIFFGVNVAPGALCKFSYSTDGMVFTEAGGAFTARAGTWIGAKIGLALRRLYKRRRICRHRLVQKRQTK